MIYLIGGTPRVGKSTLARMIMNREGIPFIPADVLTHALDHTYPQLKIRSGGWKTIPDKFYPYLEQFVRSSTHASPDYIIEGDSFLPKHVKKLSKIFNIKSVFLGTSKTNLKILIEKAGHDEWVSKLPNEEQKKLPAWLISTSKMFETEAKKHKIKYFDIAENRKKRLEEAYSYLMK